MSSGAGSFFVPGTMASHGVILVGVLCLLGVSLVIARLTEARAATHVQLLWVRLDVLDGLASGLVVGLAFGLAGALGFMAVQSHAGVSRFTPAGGLSSGIVLGIGLGMLLGATLARLKLLPAGLVLGMAGGLASGLATYWLVFGSAAGFGPELDSGVGPEVGLLFGLGGVLAGGTLGTWRARRRERQRRDSSEDSAIVDARDRNRTVKHVLGGLAAGLTLALLGWSLGLFPFMLPRYAQVPDMPPADTPVDYVLGLLFGLGIFGLAGSLVGALASGLARTMTARPRAPLPLHWAGATVGIAAGIFIGLAAGFQHADVGDPLIAASRSILDPSGTLRGLAIGLVGGAAAGLGLALLLAWGERSPQQRRLALLLGTATLCGVVALLPYWFHPLFGLDIR